jgi:hypothetical protein
MTGWDEVYRINEPRAVGETLDGETIAINLETGRYYSMNVSGSVVWELMRSGFSVRQMIDSAAERYDAERAAIEKAIPDFLAALKQSNLIVVSHSSDSRAPVWTGPKERFEFPTIKEYDDMEEMLLADPIHDVTLAGWPHKK